MQSNKKYLIRVQVGDKILTYTALIISVKDNFVNFRDRFGAIFSYNLNNVVSYEEILE